MAHLGNHALEVRYEDLLKDPKSHLTTMARFCDLPASPAAGRARASRALAYRKDSLLRTVAERWQEELQAFVY